MKLVSPYLDYILRKQQIMKKRRGIDVEIWSAFQRGNFNTISTLNTRQLSMLKSSTWNFGGNHVDPPTHLESTIFPR